ncbi:SMI1/KNR4 family protein [Deinococcus sp. YIM 134068]|uniref:SMI1/KNR4 family protein n=1 Tax=Deinococcus lichenicola TaxID=3118910 RepID=UPI002F93E280
MQQQELFRRLRAAASSAPCISRLPTRAEIASLEAELGVHLPPSYRAYLLELSDALVGSYWPLVVQHEMTGGRLLDQARGLQSIGLPSFLVPFVSDNGDAFCFDTRSNGPEFAVVLWTHDDQSFVHRSWPNFLTWVADEWLPTAEES